MQKVAHVVIPLHDPAPEAHPSVQPVAPPLRLAVLKARGLQQLQAPGAGETDGRPRATGGGFEVAVEAPPGLFAEGRRGSGDGVEGAACEAHVRDGGRGQVGRYLRHHFGREAEEARGRHLGHVESVFGGCSCRGLLKREGGGEGSCLVRFFFVSCWAGRWGAFALLPFFLFSCVGLPFVEGVGCFLGLGRGWRCVGWMEFEEARTEKIYALAWSRQYSLSLFMYMDSPVQFPGPNSLFAA